MKHPNTGRGRTSVPAPITPDLYRESPAGHPEPLVQHDLRVERILFEEFLKMRTQRDYWRERAKTQAKRLAQWKARGLATKLVSRMHPRHKESE